MNDNLIIRCARAGDEAAVRRLAALDSARVPRGALLVAEVGGRLRAALSLADGASVADPFVRSLELVALLRVRADQLRAEVEAPAPGAGRVGLRVVAGPPVSSA